MKNLLLLAALLLASMSINAREIREIREIKLDKKLYCAMMDEKGNIMDAFAISESQIRDCIARGGVVMDDLKLQDLAADSSRVHYLLSFQDFSSSRYCSKKGENLTYISCESGCTHSAQNCVKQGGTVVDM